VSVANDAGTYKTIGSIFEIVAMQGNNDESTQPKLIRKYLEFFGIKQNVIGIKEQLANNVGCVRVYPNPATETASLSFNLDSSSTINTEIFNLGGILIFNLSDNKAYPPGNQTVKWDICNNSGQRVPPGLYICRIVTTTDVKLGKIIVR